MLEFFGIMRVNFQDSLVKIARCFVVVLTIFFLSTIASGCKPVGTEEDKVIARFEQYMSAWRRHDVHSVWLMMSPKLKSGNENNEGNFEKFLNGYDFSPRSHVVRGVIVKNDSAAISAEVKFANRQGVTVGSELEKFNFIRHDGIWYFDGYEALSSQAAVTVH